MSVNKNPELIKDMFNTIAEKYDKNNNIISLGLHYHIKKLAIKELQISSGQNILDVCCGTGDIEKIILNLYKNTKVTGVDFSENMISIAEKRVPEAIFVNADATELPLKNNSFDAITMTFGLRNILQLEKALKESLRVLKPNGKLLHLDFGKKNIYSKMFDIIATAGIKIFYGKNLPYEYLINSKNEFPEPNELIKEFEQEGFKLIKRIDYLFGIISAQIFTK